MRKVVVGAFLSLDGIMQSPGGPSEDPVGGFKHGGWAVPYFDETVGSSVGKMFAKPFDLVLGRKTYDIFAAHWPYVSADDPIGPLFDRITKYVATRNPNLKPGWQNSRILGPDAVAAIKRLKTEEGPDLLTQGSPDFLQTLFKNDLVDEINILIFPVVLGKGKRLFRDGAAPAALKLAGSKASASGVTINKYIREGQVTTGSFQLEPPTEAELERRRSLS
jgi:dihydrofolate reductase